MPFSRPRTAVEVWQAANSNAANWSTSLITRRPSTGFMNNAPALTTAPSRPTIDRSTSTT